MNYNLQRFMEAQERDYKTALSEIKAGRKRSHWMWYIFPQIQGLGYSDTSRYYAIKNIQEAEAYLHHPILGKRLMEICEELIKLQSSNPTQVFGTPDDMKLRSSITLFASVPGAGKVFQMVLDKFFQGLKDHKTVAML